MMPKNLVHLLLFLLIQAYGNFGSAASSVRFYNQEGELSCVLPSYIPVDVLEGSELDGTFVRVRLPEEYHRRCGAEGLVKRSHGVQENDSKPSKSHSKPAMRWDISFLPVPGKHSSQRNDSEIEVEENLEAQGGKICLNCQPHNNLKGLTQLGRRTHERASQYQCEAQGYEPARSHRHDKASMHEIIDDYSQRAQGAIRRGYLSLVPAQGSENYERLKSLTDNFQDFESINPITLKKLMRKPSKDCYKFVKAALSNDYSRLHFYNQSQWGQNRKSANVKLVNRFCGTEVGDLTDEHWLNSEVGAGTAGPQLAKRGFINLMDSRYGVSQEFRSEKSAPEGAVLVYKCASNGQVLPASQCYGDIAIKTKTGYLRDFFTPYEITRTGRRVLVGIYIKPGGPE